MKRNFSCSGSVNHFLSHPIEGEMKSEEDSIYNGVGNGDGDDYETGHIGDKKRRLSNHQVKSLEKIFEVDNKLDPDRKVKVALDLGLQPRQVAIWFQNRRARWKTKQLETDYNLLKSNYDTLTHNYRKLEQDKEIILKELVELKAKLHEKTEIKDEYEDRQKYSFFLGSDPTHELNYEKTEKLLELKDGFSDSDSSGVLNEENLNISNTNITTTFGVSSLCSSSPTTSNHTELKDHGAAYQESSDTYLVNNVEDESCNIFLVDQAPNLCWYFRDYMN